MRRIAVLFAVATSQVIYLLLLAVSAMVHDRYDCGDSGSRAEDQGVLEHGPSDPNGLDSDNDRKACEDYPYDGNGGPVTDQYSNPPPPVLSNTTSKMPNTGGSPYLAFGAVLLLGAAVMAGWGILRR